MNNFTNELPDYILSISKKGKTFYVSQYDFTEPLGSVHFRFSKSSLKIHLARLWEKKPLSHYLVFYGPKVNLVSVGVPVTATVFPFFFTNHSVLSPLSESSPHLMTQLQIHHFTRCPYSPLPITHTELSPAQIRELDRAVSRSEEPITILRSYSSGIGPNTWALQGGYIVADLTDYDQW